VPPKEGEEDKRTYYIAEVQVERYDGADSSAVLVDAGTLQCKEHKVCDRLISGWVTLRARWVTLRARWVTLRARWVTLRARWVTLRARWVTLRARCVTLRARWVTLRARWVCLGTPPAAATQLHSRQLIGTACTRRADAMRWAGWAESA
jgi:hypothetical protein